MGGALTKSGLGNRTAVGAVRLAIPAKTGSQKCLLPAKLPANSAGSGPDFTQEFGVLLEAVSGFSVNHVQVENTESDQQEDSAGESSSGCSSDLGVGQSAFSQPVSSCSAGDSRNPGEGILRTQNSGQKLDQTSATFSASESFHVTPDLRSGRPNSKVTESHRQIHDRHSRGRGHAVARVADTGLMRGGRLLQVGRDSGAAEPSEGMPRGRSDGACSASPSICPVPPSRARLAFDRGAWAAEHSAPEVARLGSCPGAISESISMVRAEIISQAAEVEVRDEIGSADDRPGAPSFGRSAGVVAVPGRAQAGERACHFAERRHGAAVVGAIARGIPARDPSIDLAARENIPLGKRADKNRRVSATLRAIAPDRATEFDLAKFGHVAGHTDLAHRHFVSILRPLRSIRKTKPVRIFGQFNESPYAGELIRARDLAAFIFTKRRCLAKFCRLLLRLSALSGRRNTLAFSAQNRITLLLQTLHLHFSHRQFL